MIAAIFGLHAYCWALGGGWAADTLNGGSEVPPKGVIWLIAALLAAAAIVLLGRVGIGWARGFADGVLHGGAWMVAGAFWLAALINLGGDVWSKSVSAPVSALLAALATVVAVRRRDETPLRADGHLPRGV